MTEHPITDRLMLENIDCVLRIADQLDRLRENAQSRLISTQVRDRGYFLPAEEDEVLANWGSYQHARAALHEVISSVAHQDLNPKRLDLSHFLVGYSAAILLVQAARFLRHYLSDEPAIRSKLNESQPTLQIAEDTFEKIQRSLTSPSNAIKIRQARDFYENNQIAIHEHLQQIPQLQPIGELIRDRCESMDVSTTRYLKSRLQDRGQQISAAILQKGLVKAIYTIQELGAVAIGSLSTAPMHQPALPSAVADQMRETIRKGDVLVTRKENALTNYFLPGFWPHAAFSIGQERVIESLKDGVKNRSLDSVFQNDGMIILRPKLSAAEVDKAVEKAQTHVGKPYDFDFDFTRSDRMVCTEVVYRSFSGIGDVKFELTKRAGRHTLSAEDLLRMAMNESCFEITAGFHPKASETLLGGPETKALLNKTVGQKMVDWTGTL